MRCDDVSAVEEPDCVTKRHEWQRHLGELHPVLDPTSNRLRDAEGLFTSPLLPASEGWIARFEHEVTAVSEDAADSAQRRRPILIVNEDLCDVGGHRDRIDSRRRERRRIAEPPGDPLRDRLVPSDVERR